MRRAIRVYVEVKDSLLTEVVEAARKARSTYSHAMGCKGFMHAVSAKHCNCGVGRLLEALDALEEKKVVV